MKSITIDTWPLPHYEALKQRWYNNSTVQLTTTELPHYDDIVSFLIAEGDGFAFAVLSDLVEKPHFPAELLDKVFHTNDLGCQLSVCHSDHVPDALKPHCARLKAAQH